MRWILLACAGWVWTGCRGARSTPPTSTSKPSASPPTIEPTDVPPAALAAVRVWPRDGASVPENLAWVVVELTQPMQRESVLNLALQNEDEWALPRFIGTATEPYVTRAVLYGPFDDPRCYGDEPGQLCNGLSYQLWSTTGLVDQNGVNSKAPLATYSVMRASEHRVEWLGEGHVSVGDTAVAVARRVSGPCRLQDASAPVTGGAPIGLADFSDGHAVIEDLAPDHDYTWSLVCLDLAGMPSAPWPVAFQTLPLQDVRVNELVLDPVRDWNDSGGAAGSPFDAAPGPDSRATASDQWVEIVNEGGSIVDLSEWSLRFSTRSERELALLDAWIRHHVYSTAGGLVLSSGQRVVVRASSGGSEVGRTAVVQLVDPLRRVRDEVAPGRAGVADASSPEIDDEALARCQLAGGEVWLKTRATPSLANACP